MSERVNFLGAGYKVLRYRSRISGVAGFIVDGTAAGHGRYTVSEAGQCGCPAYQARRDCRHQAIIRMAEQQAHPVAFSRGPQRVATGRDEIIRQGQEAADLLYGPDPDPRGGMLTEDSWPAPDMVDFDPFNDVA